jgi:multidrug efflux system outer membrane protein
MNYFSNLHRWLFIGISFAFLGCSVGPDYKKPEIKTPASFKEKLTVTGKWKIAEPRDSLDKGRWWEIFGDKTLNQLVIKAEKQNPQLQAAAARLEQARALSRLPKTEWVPNVQPSPSYRRFQDSTQSPMAFITAPVNMWRVPFDLSYEIDLWGRVRRGFESARADAQAAAAAQKTALLSLQSDIVQTYIMIRALEEELALLDRTIQLRKEALSLISSRVQAGATNSLAQAQAETELASTQAEAFGLRRRLSEFEHALAILVGEFPANFNLSKGSFNAIKAVRVPPGLPSELLERRPDVAQAERAMAAKSAQIGVAKAAFFPEVRLTGSVGFESEDIANLLTWSSRTWSWGPSITFPIFKYGRNQSNLERARAAYEEAVANYRSQILVAFKEVEDALSGLRYLYAQEQAQSEAAAAAKRAAELARNRYTLGQTSYLEVVDAERTALLSERALLQIKGAHKLASVQLIKALGGSWTMKKS